MNKTRLFGQDQNASSKTRPVLSRIVGRIFLRVDRTDDWSFASFPRRHGDRRRAFLVHRDSALAWFTLKPAISALYRTRWGCAVGVCPASPGSRRSESLVARRRGCGQATARRRRCFPRPVTASAASSARPRAFTSTKTSAPRRRATMSISPNGVLKRRARMR
jgi:hypothetical protein